MIKVYSEVKQQLGVIGESETAKFIYNGDEAYLDTAICYLMTNVAFLAQEEFEDEKKSAKDWLKDWYHTALLCIEDVENERKAKEDEKERKPITKTCF